ncbi:hypothetical protein OBO34_21170 [Clostridiales Family XIII bacterium ASD5510]|uniref:Uncharacterized protein n=1 Tax=Hominibacterium faecale TaxID=2839743 RepID=A0A9J6QZH1_9FIRM|nr:hypothetical protein [Hominibacterium faecale]MCU7380829.1 hypothetical protein [Hominibacterium faecale]
MKFIIELNAQETKTAAASGLIAAMADLGGCEEPLERLDPLNAMSPQPPAAPQQVTPPPAPAPPVPLQPVDPAAQQAMQPQPPQAPAPVEQPAVPTQTTAYTQEQLALAATQLMDANKKQAVLDLLARYGVQALTMLPQEQYGAFATDLRALGAKL